MKNFFPKHTAEGKESGFNILTALITVSLFGIAVAVAMRLVTDQFNGSNSLSQTRGKAQVTKTVALMDCCATLSALAADPAPETVLRAETCDQINARVTETYGYPPSDERVSIVPLNGVSAEIGRSQTASDPSKAGRENGRYLGKWNYSVRCEAVGDPALATSTKYLKILTWRDGQDPLTKDDDNKTPTEIFQARSCAGVLNGTKTCT